jgi:hypothetical protein
MRCATHLLSANLVYIINEVRPLALLHAGYIINAMNPSGAHHGGDRKSVGIKGVNHPLDKPEGNTRKPLKGLGSDITTIQRMCADDLDTIKLIEIATQNPTGVNLGVDNIHARRPDGTSQQASLRRLRKHAPEIHKQVISGKLSAHAGSLFPIRPAQSSVTTLLSSS